MALYIALCADVRVITKVKVIWQKATFGNVIL